MPSCKMRHKLFTHTNIIIILSYHQSNYIKKKWSRYTFQFVFISNLILIESNHFKNLYRKTKSGSTHLFCRNLTAIKIMNDPHASHAVNQCIGKC